MNPTNVEIRQFILDTFSEDDFVDLFCSDYFPQAKKDFATDMSFVRKAQRLIEYCQNRDVIGTLLADLQKERPEAFGRRFPQGVPKVIKASPPAAVRNPRRVFISHAHQDADFAHQLANDLQQRGWVPWITPDSILPGEKWVASIARGLDESGVFLTVLTPAAITSEWVKTESDSAIDLDHEHLVRVIPLLVQQCPTPTLLRAYQRVSFLNDYGKGLAQLLDALDPSGQVVVEAQHQARTTPAQDANSEGMSAENALPLIATAPDATSSAPHVSATNVREEPRTQRPASITIIGVLKIISGIASLVLIDVMFQLKAAYGLSEADSTVFWGFLVLFSVSIVVVAAVTIGLFRLKRSLALYRLMIPTQVIAWASSIGDVVLYGALLVILVHSGISLSLVDAAKLTLTIGIVIELMVIYGLTRGNVRQALARA